MGLLVVALTVLAQPAVQVDARSRCAASVIEEELLGAGLQLDPTSELRLQLDDDGRVTLHRGQEVVLSRDLGHGTCPTFARAAALIVARFMKELPQPLPAHASAASPATAQPAPTREARRRSPPVHVAPVPPSEVPVPLPAFESTPDIALPRATQEVRSVASLPAFSPPPLETVDAPETPPVVMAPEPEPAASSVPDAEMSLRITGYEALIGGGIRAPGSVQLAPVVTLDLALMLQMQLRVGLMGAFDFGETLKVLDENGAERGKLATQGGLILPQAAWCWGDAFRGCVGAVVGLRVMSATASGAYVFQTVTQIVPAWVLGPTAQLSFRWGWVRGAVDLSAWVTPFAPTFGVEGLSSLSVPLFQGHARLSLGIAGGP